MNVTPHNFTQLMLDCAANATNKAAKKKAEAAENNEDCEYYDTSTQYLIGFVFLFFIQYFVINCAVLLYYVQRRRENKMEVVDVEMVYINQDDNYDDNTLTLVPNRAPNSGPY